MYPQEIADRFSVSRTPVREALTRLAADQLVIIAPQVGTTVSKISLRKVYEAQFIRELLERGALLLAISRMTEGALSLLSECCDRQVRAQTLGDGQSLFNADDDLHAALSSASGYRGISSVTLQARAHLDRVRHLGQQSQRTVTEMIREHHALVAAVARRDAALADDILTEHLRKILGDIGRLRSEHPAYFADDLVGPASDPPEITIALRTAVMAAGG